MSSIDEQSAQRLIETIRDSIIGDDQVIEGVTHLARYLLDDSA